jgi:hypothetical protein
MLSNTKGHLLWKLFQQPTVLARTHSGNERRRTHQHFWLNEPKGQHGHAYYLKFVWDDLFPQLNVQLRRCITRAGTSTTDPTAQSPASLQYMRLIAAIGIFASWCQ